MGKLAIIEYQFLFEPSDKTWTKGSDFERDLAKFFNSVDLEAEIIETYGGSERRVVFVKPKLKSPLLGDKTKLIPRDKLNKIIGGSNGSKN